MEGQSYRKIEQEIKAIEDDSLSIIGISLCFNESNSLNKKNFRDNLNCLSSSWSYFYIFWYNIWAPKNLKLESYAELIILFIKN